MKFPTITIPDPAAVGAWLDCEHPQTHSWNHLVHYAHGNLTTMHWTAPGEYVDARGDTPEALLADLRANIAAHDPLEKLRKEAEAAGYSLMKLHED